jgi:hypothetical protein
VTLKEAYFEYQIKGILVVSNSTVFAVHPMMYQQVGTLINLNDYIYPKPIEDEEQEVIEEMRIRLK